MSAALRPMDIDLATFNAIVARLRDLGFADDDIEWSEALKPPDDPIAFALEAIFVICNSGMRNTTARRIFERIRKALLAGHGAGSEFRHASKAAAIDTIWRDRDALLAAYLAAEDKVAWCETLPWVGPITRYHLAKNFGADVAKPDRHLARLAGVPEDGPIAIIAAACQALCEGLARLTGYRVATIDTLLWRACAEGIVDSRTGRICP